MARIIDVIEVPNQEADEMVRRLPEFGSGDFRFGSQVIVRDYQQAVFFRDGKALDTFGAGRHTITVGNAPILTDLIKGVTDGKTPFTAEVYFVSMREFLDMKWGTSEPLPLRDTDLGLVRLRAYGSFSMQVGDPALFVTKIVGAQGLARTEDITRFLRGAIIARFSDLLGDLVKAGKGLFDLPALYEEIGAGVKAKLQDDFANLGVQLKQLYVTSISPTEETSKAIDERASMGAIGDMNKYLQFQAARGINAAAQSGGGGGLAAAGVGLGAGVGMGAAVAQAIGQAMASGQAQSQPQPGAAAGVASAPDVMTLSEAAGYMRVGEEDVLAVIQSGELKAKKIGASYRIAKKSIDDYLNS